MRAGLIRQNIWHNAALHHLRQNIRTISNEPDGQRLSIFARLLDHFHRLIERMRDLVAISALQSFLDPRRINFHAEKNRAVHGGGKWLCATHSAKSAGQNKLSFERVSEVFFSRRRESFERALHDSLAADVDPRASRHLTVHREAESLEPIELGIIVPLPDEIRVRDQDTRRFIMGFEFSNRLPRLNK